MWVDYGCAGTCIHKIQALLAKCTISRAGVFISINESHKKKKKHRDLQRQQTDASKSLILAAQSSKGQNIQFTIK